jgi:hypothetical protein
MERLCRGLLVLFTMVVTIAAPGRRTDPNSVPDLAGAPAAAVIAARRPRTRRT